MVKKKTSVIGASILIVMLFSMQTSMVFATLTLKGVRTWYWIDRTFIWSVARGDVDGDGKVEIVTGGQYDDGPSVVAQLCVWNGATLALEDVTTWSWGDDTRIDSVAVGDVDGDDQMEIVTGGYYWDGTGNWGQLCVWDGATLGLEDVTTWPGGGSVHIYSVAVGDVDGDTKVEIVTGGSTSKYAQLCVWSGSTLALEDVKTWYWTSTTYISSVTVGDVDGDTKAEIVTGGSYWDGTLWIAQLCVWDGSSLALEDVTTWYWTRDTVINSVGVGDVDHDGQLEIVTGGDNYDGTHRYAQLCVWDGATLALEDVRTWYWTSHTYLKSVAVGDVDEDGQVEIVTGGNYYSGGSNAQLCVWDGATLALEDVKTWQWTSHTHISSVAVGNVDGDKKLEITTGGYYDDGTHEVAQLCVWE